jgi:hypothetical protein
LARRADDYFEAVSLDARKRKGWKLPSDLFKNKRISYNVQQKPRHTERSRDRFIDLKLTYLDASATGRRVRGTTVLE